MRAPIYVALVSALLALAAPTNGAGQAINPKDGDCQSDSPDRTIAACTRIINDLDERQRVRAVAHFRRAAALAIKGEFNRSNSDLADALRLDAKLPEYFYNRGAAAQIKGDQDRAVAEYSATIRLDPKHARAYTQRGRAWFLKGDHERAVVDWSEAIRLDPDHAAAYESRANISLAHNDYDRAIADYNESIRINPKLSRTFLDRGRAWSGKGDYDRAIFDYGEAIRLDPKNAPLYFNRGFAWEGKGDNAQAIVDYTEALRLDPKHLEAHRKRGHLYFYQGDFAAAAADLSQVAELANDAYSALWRYLARGRMDEDATAELDAYAARLKSRGWPYPVIDLYLGRRSLEEMRSAARLESIRTTSQEADETCQAEFYVGQWYLLRGNKLGAKASLKIAAETCPKSHVEYAAAVAELKRLNQ